VSRAFFFPVRRSLRQGVPVCRSFSEGISSRRLTNLNPVAEPVELQISNNNYQNQKKQISQISSFNYIVFSSILFNHQNFNKNKK
jgi:hypothetical protein